RHSRPALRSTSGHPRPACAGVDRRDQTPRRVPQPRQSIRTAVRGSLDAAAYEGRPRRPSRNLYSVVLKVRWPERSGGTVTRTVTGSTENEGEPSCARHKIGHAVMAEADMDDKSSHDVCSERG